MSAFEADAAELEDADGEPEPDQEVDGPATVLDFVPPKRLGRAPRVVQVLALALFLVTVPYAVARADQAPAITLPLSDYGGASAVLPDLPQGSALWRCLYQFDEAVQEGSRAARAPPPAARELSRSG